MPLFALLLSATAFGNFDSDWHTAARALDAAPAAYRAELDAYFASRELDDDACHAAVRGTHHARLLLAFDATGDFRIDGEASDPALLRCLRNRFNANPPPIPDTLPLAIAYRFDRR